MRLIDADELKNVLVKHFDAYFNENGRLMYSDHICISDDVSDLFNLIDKQSTAYDTDDAVERLKKASYERFENDGMGGELVVNLDDVIEIIKGGGKIYGKVD